MVLDGTDAVPAEEADAEEGNSATGCVVALAETGGEGAMVAVRCGLNSGRNAADEKWGDELGDLEKVREDRSDVDTTTVIPEGGGPRRCR
jgi:hypothetical protein